MLSTWASARSRLFTPVLASRLRAAESPLPVATTRLCVASARRLLCVQHTPVEVAASDVHPPFARYVHACTVPADAQLIFTSGQLGIAADGSVPHGAEAQTTLALANVANVLVNHASPTPDSPRSLAACSLPPAACCLPLAACRSLLAPCPFAPCRSLLAPCRSLLLACHTPSALTRPTCWPPRGGRRRRAQAWSTSCASTRTSPAVNTSPAT